jgi:hypothetical protein
VTPALSAQMAPHAWVRRTRRIGPTTVVSSFTSAPLRLGAQSNRDAAVLWSNGVAVLSSWTTRRAAAVAFCDMTRWSCSYDGDGTARCKHTCQGPCVHDRYAVPPVAGSLRSTTCSHGPSLALQPTVGAAPRPDSARRTEAEGDSSVLWGNLGATGGISQRFRVAPRAPVNRRSLVPDLAAARAALR